VEQTRGQTGAALLRLGSTAAAQRLPALLHQSAGWDRTAEANELTVDEIMGIARQAAIWSGVVSSRREHYCAVTSPRSSGAETAGSPRQCLHQRCLVTPST